VSPLSLGADIRVKPLLGIAAEVADGREVFILPHGLLVLGFLCLHFL
jgi:hypothetical protein